MTTQHKCTRDILLTTSPKLRPEPVPKLRMVGFRPYPEVKLWVRILLSATLAQEMIRVAVTVGIGNVGLRQFPQGVDPLLARGGVHVVFCEDLFGGRGASHSLTDTTKGV